MYAFDNAWLNPASTALAESFHTTLFYSPSPFGLPQLSHYGILLGQQTDVGSFSLGCHTVGFSLYRESVGALWYSDALQEDFSFGIGVQFDHVAIHNYGSSSAIGLDVGIIYTPVHFLSVGMSLLNLNGARISEDDDIPRIFVSGVSLTPVDHVTVNVDIVKDIRFAETYRWGIEFVPFEAVTVRTGFNGESSRFFGGISVTMSEIRFDYGIATHTDLGLTHSIGISFEL